MTTGSSGGTRFVVLVRDEAEAQIARAAGGEPVRSFDDPSFGASVRIAGGLDDAGTVLETGAATLFLDTTPDRLLDRFAFPDLAVFAARAGEAGAAFGFAGGLETPDVPRLLPLKPAFLAFDAAARDAEGRLHRPALDALAALFAEPDRETAFEGEPDRVFVRDLVEEMELGAYASERGRRQRVRFSVEAELAPSHAARTAANVYSYDRIMDACRSIARAAPEPFVETLAETLASELLEDMRVLAVVVRVEKLDLGPGSAGVEIRRTRIK